MKVLMTCDTVGGVWTYALELARALQPYDVEIALATQGALLSNSQRADVAQIANVEVFESPFKLEWMDDPWEDVAAATRWLQDLAEAVEPDLIHLNDYSHGAAEWDAPVLMVGHSCVFSWFTAVRGELPGAEWDRYRENVAAGLHGADLVVAPTRTMLNWLDEWYGPLPRQQVILNGRDGARFRKDLSKEPFILCAGRVWDEAKNVAAVVETAPHLRWPVAVAGLPHPDGRNPIPPGVEFYARLAPQEMAELYGRAGLYVLPARYEPFGLTPLEAALSGCPLVLGDIPTLREVWGDAAVFVPPDDRDALISAVNRLIDNADLREDYRHRADQRAAELRPQRMATAYYSAYRDLISEISNPGTRRTVSQKLRVPGHRRRGVQTG
jgi:glycogen synthase